MSSGDERCEDVRGDSRQVQDVVAGAGPQVRARRAGSGGPLGPFVDKPSQERRSRRLPGYLWLSTVVTPTMWSGLL
jgi:hypothetical protein